MLHLDLETRNHDFELQLSVMLPATGITAIYGHNGSGKTTLLRCIAGLQDCSGSIRLNDQQWLDTAANIRIPAHRRRIGYLFQDLRLFPHLDVAGNLAFARTRRPAPQEYVTQIMELLQITPLLSRSTAQLSGGERQRVALARSLITRPDLLLLDEPTAALDPHARSEVLPFLQEISSTFAVPTLLVSHAIDEVAHMAEHTLVLQAGRVATYGPTPEVVNGPAMHRLAGHGESGSVIQARTLQYDPEFQVATVTCEGQHLTLPLSKALKIDAPINLFIHARDVSLALSPPQHLSIRNIIATELTHIEELPGTPFADVHMRIGDQSLIARLTRAAVSELRLQPGMACWALIKSASLDQPA